MAALQDGNEAALAELITLWQPALVRFVFRYVQNETDAREIVHEAFVRLHARRRNFRRGAAFSAWIFAIAANLAHNHVRWRRRHPGEVFRRDDGGAHFTEEVCRAPAPDEHALESERVRAVRSAIARLPHDLKTTLLLFEYEELSYREIAAVVGCSEKGVEARLSRARARLREMLAEYLGGNAALLVEPVIPIGTREA